MARRTEFPELIEGDGNTGVIRSPGVLAFQLLMGEVNAERNKLRGLKRQLLNKCNGAWGRLTTLDAVVVKQYRGILDVNGHINPHVVGKPAWNVLWEYAEGKGAFSSRVNALVAEELKRRADAKKALASTAPSLSRREDIVAVAKAMCAKGSLYRYAQIRPYPTLAGAILLSQFYRRWDCSSSVLGWYQAGGVKNPLRANGKYDGYGHTGSLWAGGVRVGTPRIADCVFYGDDFLLGYWRPQHVAMYIGNGLVATFGSNPPRIASVDYRKDRRGYVDLLG